MRALITFLYNTQYKYLVRYQIRFGLLQAAHYGAPQTRVRFFMVAARLGYVLPDLPVPVYSFPLNDSLDIKLPHGLVLRPIDTARETLFNYISIHDAISDLPRFDWYVITKLSTVVETLTSFQAQSSGTGCAARKFPHPKRDTGTGLQTRRSLLRLYENVISACTAYIISADRKTTQ